MPKRSLKNRQIYIHLGLHKTGTSFFQKEIFPKLEDVECKNKKKFIFDISTRSDKNKILFTEEDYSVSLPQQRHRFECEDTLKNLKGMYPDAKIIIGFRDKDKWLHSCYYQYVASGGGFLSYDNYLIKYKDDILDFELYLAEVKKLWKDVLVYDFKELKKDPDALIKRICDFVGAPVPEYENKRYNISMNNTQILMLRSFNYVLTLGGRIPGYKILESFLRLIRKNKGERI